MANHHATIPGADMTSRSSSSHRSASSARRRAQRYGLRVTMLALACTFAVAAMAATPDAAKTRAYIDHAWTSLTRSQTDCASLTDSKVTNHPVLYVPADQAMPPQVIEVGKRCSVEVKPLPRKIEQLGDIDATRLPKQGLLYLPYPYVVPGGFFNEMYGWDSYFILLGLVADHRLELAKDMVDNALYEVEHYGAVLNANRTYYLSRSQPP